MAIGANVGPVVLVVTKVTSPVYVDGTTVVTYADAVAVAEANIAFTDTDPNLIAVGASKIKGSQVMAAPVGPNSFVTVAGDASAGDFFVDNPDYPSTPE